MEDNSNETMAEIDPELLEQLHYGEAGVNPISGNYSRTDIDMSIGTPNFRMNISRTYNSRNVKLEDISEYFPSKWTFSFEGKIDHTDKKIKLPGGSQIQFKNDYDTYKILYSRHELKRLPDGTFEVKTPEKLIYRFSEATIEDTRLISRLIEIRDKNGNKITLDLGNDGKIQRINDNCTGRYYTLEYTERTRYIEFIREYLSNGTPTGQIIEYRYHQNGFSAISPGGKVISYTCAGGYSLLSEVKDSNNKTIEKITFGVSNFDRDKVTTITDSCGNTKTYSYSYINNQTTITDSNQRNIIKKYKGFNIIESQDPEGKVTKAEYTEETHKIKQQMHFAGRGIKAVELNKKIYVIGGPNGVVEEYDPIKDTFTLKASMSIPRQNLGVAALNNKIYAIGGHNNPYAVEEYDPINNTWTAKSNMTTYRNCPGVVSLNNRIYVIGGDQVGNNVEEYDPEHDTWTTKTAMPTIRSGFTVSALNGKIYVMGGFNKYGTCLGTVEIFDPLTNSWSEGYSIKPVANATSTVANGMIYIIGGYDGTEGYNYNYRLTNQVQFYKVKDEGNYGTGFSLPYCIRDATSAAIYGKVYLFGGYKETSINSGISKDTAQLQQIIQELGEAISITNRNGNKYSFMRDERGNIIKQTNPDGSYRHYEYDENDNVIMEKDELGKITWYIYDENKINLVKKVQPLNGIDQYIEGVSDNADFAITKYDYYSDYECRQLGYNVKGLVKSVIDPEGNISSYTYYSDGNVKTFSSIAANAVFPPISTPTNTSVVTPAPTPTLLKSVTIVFSVCF